MKVIKKDGTLEDFDYQKIINACSKSANRALENLSDKDYEKICSAVMDYIMEEDLENDCISVEAIHAIVERTLLDLYPKSGECYRGSAAAFRQCRLHRYAAW